MALRSTGGMHSVRDLFSAAYRHKGKIFAFMLLTLLGTTAVILWYPRTYRSQAKLFVRVGRESVSLDPTATTGQMMSLMDSRETEINSAVEILRSRAITEKVVDRLTPELILGKVEKSTASDSSLAASIGQSLARPRQAISNIDPVDDRQRAIAEATESLHVDSPRDTSVINVVYSDDSPARAQEILAAILDEYSREHVRVNRTAGSLEFFEAQSQLMSQQWHEAAEKLRAAENELGIVSIPAQRKLLEEEMSRLQAQYADAMKAKAVNSARLAELLKLAEQTPARKVIDQEEGFPNEALDAMRQSLYTLEIRERELLAKFTDEHPEVIAIRDQVTQAREILGEQDERRTRMTTSVNPAREKLDLNLLTAKAEAASLATETQTLADSISQVDAKITTLNKNEVQIAELEQQIELAHRNYIAHSDNLEQSRIDHALEVDRISNVNVVQAASFEPVPASPRKSLVAAAGLFLALAGSVIIVLLCESLDNSLRTPDDVEQALDLPVLAALPRSVGHRIATSPN